MDTALYYRLKELSEKRAELMHDSKAVIDLAATEKRDLSVEENTKFDGMTAELTDVDQEIRELRDADDRQRAGLPLDQRMAELRGDRTTDNETRMANSTALGEFVKGIYEMRAQSEGVQADGGFTVPTPIAQTVMALARAKTQTIAAGARTQEMSSLTLLMPRVDARPLVTYRAENAPVAESQAVFNGVGLKAKSFDTMVRVSQELIADAPAFGDALSTELSAAFALALDGLGLYGNAAAGISGVYGSAATKTPVGTNGGPITWDLVSNAVKGVSGANYTPSGLIHHVNTEASLSGQKDSQGRYLDPPLFVRDVLRFPTTQVSTTQTVGTGGATKSDLFAGDWSHLVYGIRTNFSLQILREKYADQRQIGFLAGFRVDCVVDRPDAFQIITGITNS